MKLALCLALLLAALVSPAAAAWSVKPVQGRSVATGTAGQGDWAVKVTCVRAALLDMTFILRPPGGFDANLPVVLKIDGNETPVMTDGAGDYGLIVHEGDDFDGMSRDFLTRLTAGQSLVLDGPAAARVPAARRTFALDGAAAALRAVAAECPNLQ